MAILQGHIPFTGRVGDVVYYYVGNEIWCRTIFPNQRKRVMKEERYALFRVYSGLFRQSSKIASLVYRELGIKDDKFYRSIVSEAMKLFKETPMTGEEVLDTLWKKYIEPVCEPAVTVVRASSEPAGPTQRNNPTSLVSKQTTTVFRIKKLRFTKGNSLFKTFSKKGRGYQPVSEKGNTHGQTSADNQKLKRADEAILQSARLQKKNVAINVKWKKNVDPEEEIEMSYKRWYLNKDIY